MYVSSIRWHFSLFIDVSLLIVFSDNSFWFSCNYFLFFFNRMLLQRLSSMLSALHLEVAYGG